MCRSEPCFAKSLTDSFFTCTQDIHVSGTVVHLWARMVTAPRSTQPLQARYRVFH